MLKEASGQLEPFSRDKLFLSLHDSLKHRKSHINDATALCETIIQKSLPLIADAAISRGQLVTVATDVLRKFDPVAAVQFEAFHPN